MRTYATSTTAIVADLTVLRGVIPDVAAIGALMSQTLSSAYQSAGPHH